MSSVYNERISKRANQSIARRKKIVQLQRTFLIVGIIFVLSLSVLLGNGIKALAEQAVEPLPIHKYYTSIYIHSGDTLWDIASKYNTSTELTDEEYIASVIEMNHLRNEQIHSGEYLMIPYFTSEIK